VGKTKKARAAAGAMKKRKGSPRSTISSSSPLGLLALHLLEQWRKSGRDGIVFLSENENRTERLGSVLHSLDPSLDVLVFPRLNTLPFDGLEPSREIAGRRSSVLRRLAKTKKPVFLLSTAEAIMERLPLPTSWGQLSISLKVGAPYAEQDLQTRLEALGYDLDQEAEYPGTALFHGKTFEIFPAGALGPFRIEHSGGAIHRSWPSTRQSTTSCSRQRSCSSIRCPSALWESSSALPPEFASKPTTTEGEQAMRQDAAVDHQN